MKWDDIDLTLLSAQGAFVFAGILLFLLAAALPDFVRELRAWRDRRLRRW